MRNLIIVVLMSMIAAPFVQAEVETAGDYYVTADRLNVRLAPDSSGKVTNSLSRRQKVTVFEVKDGWARISHYYDGSVEGVSGDVARWVFGKYISSERPAEAQNQNSPIAVAIKSSHDFSKYRGVFVTASQQLIKSGTCEIGDFKEMGGWWRSSSYKPEPIYFTYCGGMTKSNRVYVNAETGETFR